MKHHLDQEVQVCANEVPGVQMTQPLGIIIYVRYMHVVIKYLIR